METPSSTRGITMSQTVASSASAAISRKTEESEITMTTKSYTTKPQKNQDRSALIDITNDSPIVGLAMGNLNTPTSAMSKKRNNTIAKFIRTPGSGEALLRGQVKTLLQKVEEEAEFSKISIENRPFLNLQGISLVAPTPANTPQILDVTLPSVNEKIMIPLKMVNEEIIEENGIESENNLVTRSLLMDFSEKSDLSDCSSVVTTDQESSREKDDEDNSSIWSMQVNASSTPDDEEEDFEEYFEEEAEEFDKSSSDGDEDVEILEEYGTNDAIIDELCQGIRKIEFAGKHIRFVYNSDDELDGEEEVKTIIGDDSGGKTKGIRFCLELEDVI